jgi:hypothetical protein
MSGLQAGNSFPSCDASTNCSSPAALMFSRPIVFASGQSGKRVPIPNIRAQNLADTARPCPTYF